MATPRQVGFGDVNRKTPCSAILKQCGTVYVYQVGKDFHGEENNQQ